MQLALAERPQAVLDLPGMAVRLLASHDGTEVIEHIMSPGTRWALSPAEGWEALEYFRVLEGWLHWDRPGGVVVLGPNSDFTACPVAEEYLFRAESRVRLLYVSSRPVFHTFSAELQEMMHLAVAVETKDGYTADHCRRITDLSMALGRKLGLSPGRLLVLNYGAFLHDIGKVGVPDHILGKPGALSEAEWQIMKRHTVIGRDMVAKTFMHEAAPIIEQHHERLDGSGYPHGLSGDEILLEAQIVAVVDSYDAITSDRVYRPARSPAEGWAELQRGAGRLYRPDVVQAFGELLQA